MNCESMQELISAYIDNELSASESEFVKRHLEGCSDCQNVLYEMQSMTGMIGTVLETIAAPDGLELRIMNAVASFHEKEQLQRLSAIYLVLAFLGAVVVVSLVVSPIGRVMRALFRLMVAAIRGMIFMSTSVGYLWMAALVTLCILLAGASLVGLSRLLRSQQSEVVL